MDVPGNPSAQSSAAFDDQPRQLRPSAMRSRSPMNGQIEEGTDTGALPANRKTATHNPPKTVAFPLILSKTHQSQARLPLRVNVRPHDTTESIISTVKNFYGLYEGNGVAFEDDSGITIIPRYENVSPNDTIHVRITKEVSPDESQPPSLWPSRPASRAHSRSPSRRRGSANIWPCQPSADQQDDRDAVNGYSDSDGGSVSGAGSRRAKSDNVASAEISVDNILEGNRRKKAKFESSELPLYIPPQMPVTASISSMSPQKQPLQSSVQSPAPKNPYNPYTPHSQTLPSPISHGQGEYQSLPVSSQGRYVSSSSYLPPPKKTSRAVGILPTPDPTIGGSVISDEDVAIQLMRLGDASNLSHGRTSTSTADDALSGKAEVASSVENSDEEDCEEERLHSRKKHRSAAVTDAEEEGEYNESFQDGSEETGGALSGNMGQRPKLKNLKTSSLRTGSLSGKKSNKSRAPSMSKPKSAPLSASKIPPSPYSYSAGNRKNSITSTTTSQQQFGTDEEDLSSKPRCQRCRKSKKGCDRQRPCGRCKDAGIGIEGCISEDEGNGRKGKYGRHMGIPVKKDSIDDAMSPIEPESAVSKKRKR